MKKATIAIALMGLTHTGLAVSEPTDAARYLMIEKVSSMDFGLFRLGEYYKAQSARVTGLAEPAFQTAFTDYVWDTNRIVVTIAVTTSAKEPRLANAQAKSACREVLLNARGSSGIDMKTGKPLSNVTNVSSLFRPASFEAKDTPANIESEILNMIELRVRIYENAAHSPNAISLSPKTSCGAPLLSTEVLFSD